MRGALFPRASAEKSRHKAPRRRGPANAPSTSAPGNHFGPDCRGPSIPLRPGFLITEKLAGQIISPIIFPLSVTSASRPHPRVHSEAGHYLTSQPSRQRASYQSLLASPSATLRGSSRMCMPRVAILKPIISHQASRSSLTPTIKPAISLVRLTIVSLAGVIIACTPAVARSMTFLLSSDTSNCREQNSLFTWAARGPERDGLKHWRD